MNLIGICVVTLLTGLVDLPRLLRRRRKRELVVAGTLLLAGFLLAGAQAVGLPVPTIGVILRALAKPFLGEG